MKKFKDPLYLAWTILSTLTVILLGWWYFMIVFIYCTKGTTIQIISTAVIIALYYIIYKGKNLIK